MIDHGTKARIRWFVDKHELTVGAQRDQIFEELGELVRAMRTGTEKEVQEELGDVEFVLRTLEYLYDGTVSIDDGVKTASKENMEKNNEQIGGKVTKN